MNHIALIGLGSIGKRHFQSLCKLNGSYNLWVFDISADSINTAKGMVPDTASVNIHWCTSISEFPKELTCAIIATTSLPRKAVTLDLLKHCKVQYLILEKFLFPDLNSFKEVEAELTKSKCITFVNCPMRTWPLYPELKNSFNSIEPITFELTGSNWGLACNSIHYLDVFTYLTGRDDFTFSSSLLNKEIIQSKRSGYIEFTGTLLASTSKLDHIAITSHAKGSLPLSIRISSPTIQLFIEEAKSKYQIRSESTQWNVVESNFISILQSNLTHLIVEELVSKGSCKLPSFAESKKLQMNLLNIFLEHYNKINNQNTNICPIT